MKLGQARAIAEALGYTLECEDIKEENRSISYIVARKKDAKGKGVRVMSASHFALWGEQRFRNALDIAIAPQQTPKK